MERYDPESEILGFQREKLWKKWSETISICHVPPPYAEFLIYKITKYLYVYKNSKR